MLPCYGSFIKIQKKLRSSSQEWIVRRALSYMLISHVYMIPIRLVAKPKAAAKPAAAKPAASKPKAKPPATPKPKAEPKGKGAGKKRAGDEAAETPNVKRAK